MQKTAENKIKCIEKGTFLTSDQRVLKAIPSEIEPNSWDIVEATPTIELTDQEILKAKALGYNLENVLKIKELIAQNYKPVQMSKETGLSRSTVYRYKKMLEERNNKKQSKYNQNTEKNESVFFILLTASNLSIYDTFSIFTLLFLFIVLISLYVRSTIARKKYIEHKEKTARLRFLLTQACNFSFRKEPIICSSDAEAEYYKTILKHYRNKNRDVCVIAMQPGEPNDEYFDRKEHYRSQYCYNNASEIKKGKQALNKYWEKLEERHLLDYLKFPKGSNWLESKAYILSAIDFIEQTPKPKIDNRIKQERLIDMLPHDKLKKQELKKLNVNSKNKTPKFYEL